jgi:hypothetical protein
MKMPDNRGHPYARPQQPMGVKKVYAIMRVGVGQSPTTYPLCASWNAVSGGRYEDKYKPCPFA